ncbi:MAG TPA: ABC transporter substrate-binding protein [Candidatus Limnocylindrales bacterium]|jgi:peptide/nickel transport system substrate-binding protein|nr:ABC transporter substrate-binding protein [Candidatus Limnocylindrales bacterium]
MDYSRLDRVRRSATPLELDLVEAFAQGRITRRQFIQRGTVLGLSLASISAVIAACSSTPSASTAPSAAASASAEASAGASSSTAPAAGGSIRVAIQKPVKVDPIQMQDLGGYGIVAQSFEFLCTLDKNGSDIAPGLAEKWTPNDTGSVWTFNLRKGVKWQDGSDFTADDVVATMGRLVAAGNSGLKGIIDEKSAVATDPNTVTFNLLSPNGNFPYLVSVFNAQTVITPKDYTTGTTLDAKPNGTGAWKLDSFNPTTGATFSRNPTWWGGQTPLDSVEFVFFDATGPMVTAYQGGQVDCIVQFDVLSGEALLSDANTNVIATRAALHRQIWMRVDTGQFTKKEVRQALALSLDRPAMIEQLFKGKADLGNDHVIAPIYPYFDDSVPQRTRDIAKAKSLLAAAGTPTISAKLHAGQLLEIPDLATLIKSQAAEAGFNLEVAVESLDTFYGAQWCPETPKDPPCSGAAELGIVDYGHRATPDVYLNAALKSKGIWNSSQYNSPEFDAAFGEFQAAIGVDAQKAACKKIETILNEDVPIALPYWYNYLAGSAKKYSGIYSSALGQMFFSAASQSA